MTEPCPSVESTVKELFGTAVGITSRSPMSGGCINTAWRLALSDGTTLFMKENTAGFRDMFLKEAKGLEALQTPEGPVVPKPLAVRSGADRQFILMEFIPGGRPGRGYWEAFGRAFAAMHSRRASEAYGFDEDNFIGSTVQENPWSDSWVAFFGEHRLGFQIRLAARRGLASSQLVDLTDRLIAKLPERIPEPDHPSVLHGDLWGGNAMAGPNGEPVIFDPATYYGHNEADLAMTELVGRFAAGFYDAYNEVLPLSAEYETRKEVYGLYHILNHLNLFGAAYASQALSMLRRLV